MKVSENGLKVIKESEGLRLKAYRDTGGVWTIGYGHTRGVKPGNRITMEVADAYLKADVRSAESDVSSLVKVELNQNQYDALVSFVFNIGHEQFSGSTLLRKLNTGDYSGAAAEFPRWRHDNGKVIAGLVTRRAKERDLFESTKDLKPPEPKPEPGMQVVVDMPTIMAGARGSFPRTTSSLLLTILAGGGPGQDGLSMDDRIRMFQRTSGLMPDGVVGPKTWAALVTNWFNNTAELGIKYPWASE